MHARCKWSLSSNECTLEITLFALFVRLDFLHLVFVISGQTLIDISRHAVMRCCMSNIECNRSNIKIVAENNGNNNNNDIDRNFWKSYNWVITASKQGKYRGKNRTLTLYHVWRHMLCSVLLLLSSKNKIKERKSYSPSLRLAMDERKSIILMQTFLLQELVMWCTHNFAAHYVIELITIKWASVCVFVCDDDDDVSQAQHEILGYRTTEKNPNG